MAGPLPTREILLATALRSRDTFGPVATAGLWFFAHTIPWFPSGPTSIDSLVTSLIRSLPGLFGWFWEIAYDQLMHPTAHKASFDELASWLGKFRDLLLATAQSPAMLFYLDNFQSVSPDANRGGARRRAFPRRVLRLRARGGMEAARRLRPH